MLYFRQLHKNECHEICKATFHGSCLTLKQQQQQQLPSYIHLLSYSDIQMHSFVHLAAQCICFENCQKISYFVDSVFFFVCVPLFGFLFGFKHKLLLSGPRFASVLSPAVSCYSCCIFCRYPCCIVLLRFDCIPLE